ncbi:PepSY domain-containing protein [Sphingomonas sabuli]|uniref:PepSY domain-containing protein n=1 Tax=Sphingomonas sabuli TaxID=2764186 RepID=A0A7G9L5J5_9SPHN|nr:PepSY domain-containing protein [Sphingomonas sabuli]
MMRKLHRWLAVLFGAFLLWISATGVLSHIGTINNEGLFESDAGERARPALPEGFVCPETVTCRPKPAPQAGQWNVGYLHHLHSGEEFGPVGTIVSLLSGLALFFFAFSGLYLYIQMYRGRIVRVEQGKSVRGGRVFW